MADNNLPDKTAAEALTNAGLGLEFKPFKVTPIAKAVVEAKIDKDVLRDFDGPQALEYRNLLQQLTGNKLIVGTQSKVPGVSVPGLGEPVIAVNGKLTLEEANKIQHNAAAINKLAHGDLEGAKAEYARIQREDAAKVRNAAAKDVDAQQIIDQVKISGLTFEKVNGADGTVKAHLTDDQLKRLTALANANPPIPVDQILGIEASKVKLDGQDLVLSGLKPDDLKKINTQAAGVALGMDNSEPIIRGMIKPGGHASVYFPAKPQEQAIARSV